MTDKTHRLLCSEKSATFSPKLEAGHKVLIKERFCQKLKLNFNLLDLDRLFASDLKYLRKGWDLLCIISAQKFSGNHIFRTLKF